MNSEIVFQIEKELQFSPHTHKDFVELSNFIVDKTKQYISATTLKRVWGPRTTITNQAATHSMSWQEP